jgi:hypothetical protein
MSFFWMTFRFGVIAVEDREDRDSWEMEKADFSAVRIALREWKVPSRETVFVRGSSH